jgi:hypothetical protein
MILRCPGRVLAIESRARRLLTPEGTTLCAAVETRLLRVLPCLAVRLGPDPPPRKGPGIPPAGGSWGLR